MIAWGHLLWMGAGAIGLEILKAIWRFFANCFGFGFREGMIAAIKKGSPLTPEESAALQERVKEKLARKLEKEQEAEI